MAGCVFTRDEAELKRLVQNRTREKRSAEELRARGVLVGTAHEFRAQLELLEENGVQEVMLQWLELDDLERLEAMAALL